MVIGLCGLDGKLPPRRCFLLTLFFFFVFSFIHHSGHHCRLCGNVCCATCSSHTAVLPNLYDKRPVRVCFRCHEIIAKSRVASIKANGGNENLDVCVRAVTVSPFATALLALSFSICLIAHLLYLVQSLALCFAQVTSVLRHASVVKAPSAGLLAAPSVDSSSGGGAGGTGSGGSGGLSPTASSAPKTPGHLQRGASLDARSAESATASPVCRFLLFLRFCDFCVI